MQALIICSNPAMAWHLPRLLARAGFSSDVLTSSLFMRKVRCVRNCYLVSPNESVVSQAKNLLQNNYDWIILTEDGTLLEFLSSSLSTTQKLKFLPVQSEENFSHLSSKIGLSKAFSDFGVATPPFAVANDREEAYSKARKLIYPILLKIDVSGGGCGVFECHTPSDIDALPSAVFEKPILVQKKIEGIELDLSALYFQEKLIHFNYAKIEKTLWKFGPSYLRTYRPLGTVEEPIFQELTQIGKALGANGFTNISCMQSNEGVRYYIEVDMRPNVWVETPRFLNEDPAIRIRNWFAKKEILKFPVPLLPGQPKEKLIPYFLRLKRRDLLLNRYNVWKFIPKSEKKIIAALLLQLFSPPPFSFSAIVKKITPKNWHPQLRLLKKAPFFQFIFHLINRLK